MTQKNIVIIVGDVMPSYVVMPYSPHKSNGKHILYTNVFASVL